MPFSLCTYTCVLILCIQLSLLRVAMFVVCGSIVANVNLSI